MPSTWMSQKRKSTILEGCLHCLVALELTESLPFFQLPLENFSSFSHTEDICFAVQYYYNQRSPGNVTGFEAGFSMLTDILYVAE
ncbi:hypothetical protein DTO282F9_113 [Paecilomyces variotii]|nr:hypothetical protein DTO282F9_113 [Paecilomyces variotii]